VIETQIVAFTTTAATVELSAKRLKAIAGMSVVPISTADLANGTRFYLNETYAAGDAVPVPASKSVTLQREVAGGESQTSGLKVMVTLIGW